MDTDVKMMLDDTEMFCEHCEEMLSQDKFTMDDNGEVCDDCCIDHSDRQYDAWKEQEAERQMEQAENDKAKEPESDMSGASERER